MCTLWSNTNDDHAQQRTAICQVMGLAAATPGDTHTAVPFSQEPRQRAPLCIVWQGIATADLASAGAAAAAVALPQIGCYSVHLFACSAEEAGC